MARTGCTGYVKGSTPPPNAAGYGSCTWHGKRLTIYTFRNVAQQKKFLAAMRAEGLVRARVAVGGLVVAAPEDLARLPELRRLLKG